MSCPMILIVSNDKETSIKFRKVQSLLSGARKPESVPNHLEKAPGRGKEEEDTFT